MITNSWKKFATSWVTFSLFYFLLPLTSSAFEIKGFAQIELTRGKKHFQFEQVIIIKQDNSHHFETIDDFGNSIWTLKELDQKKLKKLGFKLSLQNFLDIISYKSRPCFPFITTPDSERKEIIHEGGTTVFFENFKITGQNSFPWKITLKSNKASLIIKWIHLDITSSSL